MFTRRCATRYLVVVGVVLSVLLLQQLPLPPLLLQRLLNERGHLALLARTLPANHKPATSNNSKNDRSGYSLQFPPNKIRHFSRVKVKGCLGNVVSGQSSSCCPLLQIIAVFY